MIKVLITGDRKWKDKDRMFTIMLHLLRALYQSKYNTLYRGNVRGFDPEEIIIINGDAEGVDKMSTTCALELGVPINNIKRYPAQWNDVEGKHPGQIGARYDGSKYWKSAGPVRNRQMIKENPDIDICLAFHDDIVSSRGTKDMIGVCYNNNIQVVVFKEKEEVLK